MWVKIVDGLNLYTDKVPIVLSSRETFSRCGPVVNVLRRCAVCEELMPKKKFSVLVRNICKPCVKAISEEGT